MTAIIGHIGELKPEVETITTYLERLEVFLAANGIEEGRKSAVPLSCIGSRSDGIVKNLCDLPDSYILYGVTILACVVAPHKKGI